MSLPQVIYSKSDNIWQGAGSSTSENTRMREVSACSQLARLAEDLAHTPDDNDIGEVKVLDTERILRSARAPYDIGMSGKGPSVIFKV